MNSKQSLIIILLLFSVRIGASIDGGRSCIVFLLNCWRPVGDHFRLAWHPKKYVDMYSTVLVPSEVQSPVVSFHESGVPRNNALEFHRSQDQHICPFLFQQHTAKRSIGNAIDNPKDHQPYSSTFYKDW